MSEEAIISKIEYIIRWKDFGDEYTREDIEIIEELYNLYQKEKEKNKELEFDKRVKEEKIHNLEQAILSKNRKHVSKDKIREIIYPSPDNYIPVEVQMSEMYRKIEKLLKESE